jgi:chromate transporter
VILVCLGLLYRVFSGVAVVHSALAGMAAVAAGLLLSSAVGMAAALPRRFVPWIFMVGAFVAVGVLRWPLLYVLLGLAPIAVWVAWRRQ